MTFKNITRNQTYFLFSVLFIYVLLQFSWWTFHIFDLHRQMHNSRKEYITLSGNNSADLVKADEEYRSKLRMIIGEGAVFLLLLTIGGIMVLQSYKKETDLARQQKNFMLAITHELKSPIAATRLNIQTVLSRSLSPSQSRKFLENSLSETQRLSGLIDNILTAAQLESHMIKVQKEWINLAAIAGEIAGRKTGYTHCTHKIDVAVPGEFSVLFDKSALEKIIGNLLDNAINYSPDNSLISLRAEKYHDHVHLIITDEGTGILDSEKKNIFKKFYRIGSEETRTGKGSGLGLFIVKELVENNEGRIIVKDNKPIGTVFEIIFKA